jgi:acyl transferase domain-containing protein
MDPQFRLQLELVYEAMESGRARTTIHQQKPFKLTSCLAGLTLEHLAGSDTSVYAGACFRDYHDSLVRDPDLVPRYLLTGNGAAMSSNRISYFYDLHGPSITVDTGCSTTLTALHLACQGLRNRESTTAIITGANVILNPDMFATMSSLGYENLLFFHSKLINESGFYHRKESPIRLILEPMDMVVVKV